MCAPVQALQRAVVRGHAVGSAERQSGWLPPTCHRSKRELSPLAKIEVLASVFRGAVIRCRSPALPVCLYAYMLVCLYACVLVCLQPSWASLRELGVPLWLKNDEELRKIVERCAKTQVRGLSHTGLTNLRWCSCLL